MLPPVRRGKRRDWGRIVARILCVLFAVIGLVPVGVGLLVRTSWARGIAQRETQKVLAKNNIDATFELTVRLWPLSVGLRNLRVAATDGGTPFLTARSATARPKIFALLAGKVAIDQIEIEKPTARVVLRDGKLKNLAVELPESKKDAGPSKPPFSVVSASEGELDLDIDGTHVVAHRIDADVTTDVDDEGATAFEVALRLAEARGRIVREVAAPSADDGKKAAKDKVEYAVDEDVLCAVDGRARIEKRRVLVRRFSAHGAADLDPADGTVLGCDLPKGDKRAVDVALGHFAVVFPKHRGEPPNLDGHARIRAPLALVNRFVKSAPQVDGWAMLDAELRYTPETPIPDMSGRLEAGGLRVEKFSFARSVKSDFTVRRSVVTSPLTRIEIAGGVADLRDVEVQPLAKGLPLKASVDVTDVSFVELMQDLGVTQHPHVTWDLREVHAQGVKGTLDPLRLDGDLSARTTNFAVYDDAVDSPTKTRATGVREGNLKGKIAIRQDSLEFHNITVTTPKGLINDVFVSIGFHEVLRVDVPKGKVDLDDVSPIGSVAMAGVAELEAHLTGAFNDPHLEGDVSIQGFAIGDPVSKANPQGPLEFGDVTHAHVTLEQLSVLLRDVRGQKNKSTYEMPTGRLDFGGPATMKMESQITSKSLDVRDFFSIFHLEEDPRFADLEGTIETNARMRLVLGGPEDVCKGGLLDVTATTTLRAANVFGEHFDEGHADFEYHWLDRQAGIEGADIEVRSLTLTKLKKKDGRAPLGTLLGSLSIHHGELVAGAWKPASLRGSLVLQGFPLGRTDLLGVARTAVEGSASGVARVGGAVQAFDVQADVDVTPVRVFGAPFGASYVHVGFTQTPPNAKVVGKTACGAPVTEAFDKDKWLKSQNDLQGAITLDGSLFGDQIMLDHVLVTRQKAPIVNGRIVLARFDLGPIGKAILANDEQAGAPSQPLGGEISGELLIEKIPVADIGQARARFAPKAIKITRGGQRLAWRPAPVVASLADDELTIPPMTFELAAPNGFKGAFAVKGAVKKVTAGGELALDAELAPIDLGILVGIVPRLTRASGTLDGSVRVRGKASEPTFDGQLRVRRGEFAGKGLPGTITDVEVDVVADENEARVTRAVGHFLGGDVSATARMPLKGGQIGVAEATVTARQLFVAPVEGVKATVDADLVVSLNPYAATTQGRLPVIGGDVTITSFEYSKPITLELNGITGGAKRTVVEAYDPSLDSMTLSFDVHSRVPLRIRNNLVDAMLRIDPAGIHVSGTNQRVGLRGELVTIAGGHFRVFANDFEVQKGTIRFDDPTRIAPKVDITATTEYRRYTNTLATAGTATNTTGGAGATAGGAAAGGGRVGSLWRIKLHAYGDVDNLQVDMTSDPPLSREDIFFLLTIGLTRAEVDQVRYGGAAAGLAFETIGTASGVDRAVKQALPVIDDFRPGTAYSPRTGRVEPNITVGRRLTENVRANLTSGLAEDPQLRSTIEWRLNRTLTVDPSYDRINTVSSSNVGNFGVDFRWRLEFN